MSGDARLAALLQRLVARGHRGMRLGLERVRAAAAALGDPQESFAAIHVGGTNGKGSVSAMIERALGESGMRTGLFTSPHLVRFSERIQIGGTPIDDEAFAAALQRVFEGAHDELTFFETLALAGFVAFRDARVDVAVLEVGLGGRLDATNIVRAPRSAAIVSITEGEAGRWLEHAEHLGRDVPAIAREKAGIAKLGAPLVLGPMSDEARRAVVEVAGAAGARPIWQLGTDRRPVERASCEGGQRCRISLESHGGGTTCELPDGASIPLRPALPGAHQLENAAVAAAAVHASGLGVSAEAMGRGIERARWPGRLERVVHEGRDVWLDCAHNVEGARALRAAALGALGAAPTAVVFGALADKPWEAMARVLMPAFPRRIFTEPPGRSPADPEALRALFDGEVVRDPVRALGRALEIAAPGEAVLVTGSIYLVGRVRAALLGLVADPAMGL